MRNNYLKLQIKRAFKHYPAILAVTILLIVCISLSCVLIINKNNSSDSKQKIKIGITGDLSQTYLDIGIAALQNLDTSRFSIEFTTLNEESAKKALQSGDISGYIRIPEDFVKSVVKMDNIPLVYVTNDSPTGFGSILMNEVAKTISDTVAETQKGIYGMQKLSEDYKKTQDYKKNTQNLNIAYITSILQRTNTFKTEYLGLSDGLSMGAYFVCGGIMVFMLLWGISCNSYLYKKDRSIEKLLISKGHSVIYQLTSEYLSFLIITLITFIILAGTGGFCLQYIKTGIPELDSLYTFDYIMYIVKIIPVIMMITALQFLLYECISGYVGAILSQFVFALGTGYICGCLYPSHYFPDSIQKTASLLPTGIGVSYMRMTLSSSLTLKTFLGSIIYTAVFIILAVICRKHRNAGKE